MTSNPVVSSAQTDVTDLNVVASFLAQRDLPELSPEALSASYGIERADVLVLAGNSLPRSADAVARAWRAGAASRLLIAGGVGHSTDDLRRRLQNSPDLQDIVVDGRSEAEMLRDILECRHKIAPGDLLLETRSGNCGANVEGARRVLSDSGLTPGSIIVVQDPLMQRRTLAAFERVWADDPGVELISFAPFIPRVTWENGTLEFEHPEGPPPWEIDRFLELVMGEYPRLRDDASGYGPRGRGFISHVPIPEPVSAAYERLRGRYGSRARPIWMSGRSDVTSGFTARPI